MQRNNLNFLYISNEKSPKKEEILDEDDIIYAQVGLLTKTTNDNNNNNNKNNDILAQNQNEISKNYNTGLTKSRSNSSSNSNSSNSASVHHHQQHIINNECDHKQEENKQANSKDANSKRQIALAERLQRSKLIWYLPSIDHETIINNLINKQIGVSSSHHLKLFFLFIYIVNHFIHIFKIKFIYFYICI